MLKKMSLTIPLVALAVAVTAQAAAASTHRHTRTSEFGVMSERVRNSNAYAAPAYDTTAAPYHFHYLKGSCWDLGTCD